MPTFPEPPNRKAIVEAVFARGGFNIKTHDGCGRFTEAVLLELDQADPGEWFHLKKTGGQNKYNGHAVDGGVHGPTGYFVDFIGSSASPNAKPAWSLDRVKNTGGPRYKGRTDLFLPATLGDGPPPPQPPPPVPPDDTRALDALTARVVAAEAVLDQQSKLIADLEISQLELQKGLEALEQPSPEMVFEGVTSSKWGHSHEVRAIVRPGRQE